MRTKLIELSERDTQASRLWERWIDALSRTHVDEAILLLITLMLLGALGWGVWLVLTQAQALGVVFLPIACWMKSKALRV